MIVWPPRTSCGPRSSVPPATSRMDVQPLWSRSVTSVCVSSSRSTTSLTLNVLGICANATVVARIDAHPIVAIVLMGAPVRELILLHGQGGFDALAGERHLANSGAGGVENGVPDRRSDDRDRGLAGARRPNTGPIDEHALDHRNRESQRQRVIGPPVDRGHVSVVPRDLLAERPAQTLQRAPFNLIRQAIRIADGATVLGDDDPRDATASGGPVDVDVGHHRHVTVVALVGDARDAPPAGGTGGARGPDRAPRPLLPICRFRGSTYDLFQPRIRQVAQPIFDRVSLDLGRDLVDEALMREGVLEPGRRSQRPGVEGRLDRVRQDTLALHRPRPAALPSDTPGEVRRRGVAAIAQFARRLGGPARRHGGRLEAGKLARDDVAGLVVAGPPSFRDRPRLAVPRDDAAAGVDAGALVDDGCKAVILPRHFVLP